jgi:fucokinase
VLTGLAQLLGVKMDQARLFDEVLCLEQMLTTGGGWQDQVGGLVRGIKLATTKPGLPQKNKVSPVQMSPETQAGLVDRLRLVYNGQQRLAKNLLRAVMGRWVARDPEIVWIQREIARLAKAMRDALRDGDPHPAWDYSFQRIALNACPDGARRECVVDLTNVLCVPVSSR